MAQGNLIFPTSGTLPGLELVEQLNEAFGTVISLQSGATDPATIDEWVERVCWWADTGNDLLKLRNPIAHAWADVLVLSNGQPVAMDSKQDVLVSGESIKTVGGASLLGNGDVPVSAFPSGTKLLFQQSTAPTGWSKIITHNDKALRVVSGTAGSGGSSAFSSVFGSRTPSGSVSVSGGSVGNTTLTTTQMPSHPHGGFIALSTNGGGEFIFQGGYGVGNTLRTSTDSNGGGSSHGHTYTAPTATFSGATMDFTVAYVDAIICQKD